MTLLETIVRIPLEAVVGEFSHLPKLCVMNYHMLCLGVRGGLN